MDTVNNNVLPVIPLRGLNIFPGEIMHCDIGRKQTLQAMQYAIDNGGIAFLCLQEDKNINDFTEKDFSHFGTVCRLRQVFRIQGDSVHLLVTGLRRARILSIEQTEPYYTAKLDYPEEIEPDQTTAEALYRRLVESFFEFSQEKNRLTKEQRDAIAQAPTLSLLTDAVAQQCVQKINEKQMLLEMLDIEERAISLIGMIREELEILKVDKRISSRIKQAMERNQKEFVLREQLRAVKDELGEGESSEADEYRERMKNKNLPDNVREKLEKEIERFAGLPHGSHEQPMAQAYIECILDLPWTEESEDNLDLAHAREILDRDHYGMEKVKERIIEMLAVQKLTNHVQGQILCLIGPPGVGKTSIARAVAEAMGRKFVRMSLGGVHDESEIRGHRRTYIGAESGRIIDAMKQAGTINPLLLFDEIDKLSASVQGDPSAAMLEVLDSAQNNAFCDHFLEIPYDLSKCLLMTTANDAGTIPRPLLDRMEIIEVPSYLFNEKLEIAKRHLVPKQLKLHGLTKSALRMDNRALSVLIENYTKEAGVRELERVIASVCRKTACEVVNGHARVYLSEQRITDWLGPKKYLRDTAGKDDKVGIVTGLAWTSVGGETLEIEAAVVPGKGNLQLTGRLGDVMQESARAALTYIRAHADVLGISSDSFEKIDIHIHVPEGAVPKDGPSAGIGMLTALTSALTGIGVHSCLAMTGEITLSGRVLPIGGLREKLLAAVRAGVDTVLLPEKNREDLFDIPEEVKNMLRIIFVSEAGQVLENALVLRPQPACMHTSEEEGKANAAVRH